MCSRVCANSQWSIGASETPRDLPRNAPPPKERFDNATALMPNVIRPTAFANLPVLLSSNVLNLPAYVNLIFPRNVSDFIHEFFVYQLERICRSNYIIIIKSDRTFEFVSGIRHMTVTIMRNNVYNRCIYFRIISYAIDR